MSDTASQHETLMRIADAMEGRAIASNNDGYGQDDATWARCFTRAIAFQEAADLVRHYARLGAEEDQP